MDLIKNFLDKLSSSYNVEISYYQYTLEGWNPLALKMNLEMVKQFIRTYQDKGKFMEVTYHVQSDNTIVFYSSKGANIEMMVKNAYQKYSQNKF